MKRRRESLTPLAAVVLGVGGFSSGAAVAGEWVAHNDGLRNLTVNGIGIAPSDPNTIYIQARSLGVHKSTDGGGSWNKTATFNSDNGPGYDHIIHEGPAVHPADPDIVWVASGGKVYKTTNGGSSWFASSTGTTVNGCDGVHGVVIDPNPDIHGNYDHLFAGTIISGCDGGVFESTDGGANWTYIAGSGIGGGLGNDAWPIALDASETNRLYAGSPHNSIRRSTDGGHNWLSTPPVSGDHSTYEVVINPLAPHEIWCNEVGGTWVSTDYGATWTRQTDLFNDEAIYALRFAPSNGQIAYAIVGDTIWRSGDNGGTWFAEADVLGGPRCLEIDPANPDVVYVGTWGLGMYKSTDGAQSFSEINAGLPMTDLINGYQAFGDPLEEGAMYCILGGNVVYRLGVGESDWQYYSVAPDDFVQIERQRPDRWYCALGGLWRSLDSGLTWEEVYNEGADTSVYDFWLDPRRCGRILVGDRDGSKVLLSEDGGDTWTLLGNVPATYTYLSGISGDPFDPDNIIIAASPQWSSYRHKGYVWRSADGGQSWEHIREGMFYDPWRIGMGYWLGWYGTMRQEVVTSCNYHVNIDDRTFGDGTYECRIRILASENNDMNKWAGFLIRTESPDSDYQDSGWLVYMRRNGVVAMHGLEDGTVINIEQTPVVGDTSQWNTIRLVAAGNHFELYANDSLVDVPYTDLNHRYDDPGYFALQTCSTRAEFDDVDIEAETSFTEAFDLTQRYGASYGRWVTADPHHPGRFALSTQWGGLWYSTDHGATWQRISSDSREGNIFYRPLFSTTHSGNLYVNNGSYYTWRFENYYNDGMSVQQIGQTLSYSSVVMSEDPFDLNRLYACIYDLGISIYDDEDIAGEPAPPVAVAIDLDHDGDIDQSDFGLLQVCFSGPGVPQYDRGCVDALIDDDDDVDTGDLMLFLDCMSGPGVGPDPACDCFRP